MEFLPVLDMFPAERERRWTVLLRLILLIPQVIVLWFLGILAAIVAIIGWFAALVLGRLPGFAATYLTDYLTYQTRVYGYGMLLVDRYPPFSFSAPDYPIQVQLQPGKLNRLAVFFRIILVIPAAIVQSIVYDGWLVCVFFIWLIVLVLGRMPKALFQASAAVLRFSFRVSAYFVMLTPAYPKRLLGDQPHRDYEPAWGTVSATRPLTLTGGAQGLLVVFIIVGVLSWLGSGWGGSSSSSNSNSSSVTRVHDGGMGGVSWPGFPPR